MHTQYLIRQLVLVGTLAIPLVASARPEVNYGLSVSGDLWGNDFSSSFNFDDDFSLSGMNMNLSGPQLRAQAGDVSANWDQLGLASRSFQGLSTGFALGKVDLSLLGGTVVLQPDYLERRLGDLLATAPAPIVSPVYGVRASLPLGNKFDLSASQLIAPKASAGQGKGIGTLALNYQHSAQQNLALEMAHSRQGNGWQLSGATQGERLRLQASYRRTDLGFSTAGNPTLLTRRNGGFINGSYRLSQPLTLTANSQRYDDGLEGHSNYDSLALRYAQPKRPVFSLFWRHADMQRSAIAAPTSGSTPPASTVSTSMGFRVSHRLGANRVSAQYERLQFSSTATPSSDKTSDRFMLGLSRPLGRQTQLSLFQILDLSAVDRISYTSLGLQHRLGDSGLTVDLGLQYVNKDAAGISGQATSLRTGLNYALGSGSSIGLQYQTSVAGSGSLSARGTSQLYIGYSHSFNQGSGRGQNLSLRERRQLGKVSGRVFEDANANGKWESSELGVPDVMVNATGGLRHQTDASGHFSMADVRPGSYQFGLETKTLPIEYTTLADGDVTLLVAAGKSTALDIPVVRTGQVRGIVFQDSNRNGLRDEGEQGVANAIVKVAGGDIISFTDPQGRFTLHDLAPRKWQVTVDISMLGEDVETTGAGFALVTVPSNGEVAGVALGIAEKERPVISSFQQSQ